MKFPDMLITAIQRSEIPLRFEPGAEESVAKPVLELLEAWLEQHEPSSGGAGPGDAQLVCCAHPRSFVLKVSHRAGSPVS